MKSAFLYQKKCTKVDNGDIRMLHAIRNLHACNSKIEKCRIAVSEVTTHSGIEIIINSIISFRSQTGKGQCRDIAQNTGYRVDHRGRKSSCYYIVMIVASRPPLTSFVIDVIEHMCHLSNTA